MLDWKKAQVPGMYVVPSVPHCRIGITALQRHLQPVHRARMCLQRATVPRENYQPLFVHKKQYMDCCVTFTEIKVCVILLSFTLGGALM